MRALADLVARWRTPPRPFPDDSTHTLICVLCGAVTAQMPDFARLGVCENCGYHHALSAWQRIDLLADPDTFREVHASTTSIDPLQFPAGGDYRKQLREAFRRTRLREAVITGRCQVRGRDAVLIVMEFGFLGGSMGVVVGERVAQAFEYAARRRLPVISVVTSSGIRIREGVLALLQMPKTVAAAQQHSAKGLAHLAILGNPSTGGVFASFANTADVIIGEPGALMGFTALRDLERAEGGPLPPETHTAESHLEHGLIDQVVSRSRQRDLLTSLLDLTAPRYRLELTRRLEPFVGRPPRRINRWQEVQLARHQRRPTALDFIGRMMPAFVEIHGDRQAGDDETVVAGFGDLGGEAVVVVGQVRPRGSRHEAGWMRPEGLRKAVRAMRLAEKFHLPLLTLIDTAGVHPGRTAEEHGVGQALAACMATLMALRTPTVAIIIGEGGSEGAAALAVADRVLMLEHATFSVISPEAAAAHLFRDAARADTLAEALRLSASDARSLGVADRVVREPEAGAHANHAAAADLLKTAILASLSEILHTKPERLVRDRSRRYRAVGIYQNFFRVSLGRNLADLRALLAQRRGRLGRRRRRAANADPDIPID